MEKKKNGGESNSCTIYHYKVYLNIFTDNFGW